MLDFNHLWVLTKTCLECFQVVITSYEMLMRLACDSCCKGGPSVPGSRGPCLGPEVRQTVNPKP